MTTEEQIAKITATATQLLDGHARQITGIIPSISELTRSINWSDQLALMVQSAFAAPQPVTPQQILTLSNIAANPATMTMAVNVQRAILFVQANLEPG